MKSLHEPPIIQTSRKTPLRMDPNEARTAEGTRQRLALAAGRCSVSLEGSTTSNFSLLAGGQFFDSFFLELQLANFHSTLFLRASLFRSCDHLSLPSRVLC